jgi:hypothetical protein
MIQINELINCPVKMNETQINFFAPLVYEKFKIFKPEDLKLWVMMSVAGEFETKIFGRIDGSILLEWADAYIAHRLSAAEQEQEQETHKNMEPTPRISGLTKLGKLLKNI